MANFEVSVQCEECNNEADRAICQKHIERLKEINFEEGKKVGYEEGYAAAKAELEQ